MRRLLAAGGNRRTRQAQRQKDHGQASKPAGAVRDGVTRDPAWVHNQDASPNAMLCQRRKRGSPGLPEESPPATALRLYTDDGRSSIRISLVLAKRAQACLLLSVCFRPQESQPLNSP